MKTQREFMMTVVEQCLQSKSIDEIKKMINVAFENIDTNMSVSYILSYLVYAYNFKIENLELSQLPGASVYSNEVWVFKYQEKEAEKLISDILEEFNEKESKKQENVNEIQEIEQE